eukprot:CAMPEP_0197394144 /NCGR_PEP_ID=MMETSP1165-20131217/4716_1 /TAXON_ID=284809 /ORGANISM="Chrysocystis fragilis, Strain CCMP3189" /LENGTH=121 /DNA_ID=CAMNT_0042919829 /DNA_START=143 /DNA_END=508 /DNA_ORIENTATION=+
MKRSAALILAAIASTAAAFVPSLPRSLAPTTTSTFDRAPALDACRRNTKKEKRQRNLENMRKFKRAPGPVTLGRAKKVLSRKKMTLKAQAAKEKEREAAFMARLFVATGPMEETKLDLGIL